jgi:hypothetical protein
MARAPLAGDGKAIRLVTSLADTKRHNALALEILCVLSTAFLRLSSQVVWLTVS